MPRPNLRVHLVHQSYADYVGALIDGLADPAAVLAGDQPTGAEPPIDLHVSTILSGSARTSPRRGPVDVQTYHLPRFRDPRSLPKALVLVRSLLAESHDVVHWQAGGNPWVDLAYSLLISRRPSVVTVHDMVPHPGDRNAIPGATKVVGRLARRADRVIVHAPHIHEQAASVGVDPARIVVMPHGELGSRYRPPDKLPLAPSSERSVLAFGRAQGYKGIDLLAEAMPRVVDRVPEAKLIVAGSGPSLDEAFPPGQPPPPWAEIHRGQVDDDAVTELFARAAVVALPYREASGSGVAALAAGFGRAVAASAIPGLQDVVEDGRTGRLFPANSVGALADCLIELLEAPNRTSDLGQGAFQAARTRLSWATIGDDLIDLYHEVSQARSGPRPVG